MYIYSLWYICARLCTTYYMIVPLCAKVSYLYPKCDECVMNAVYDTPLCVSGQNMSATNWRVEIIWDSSDKIMETCGKLGLGLMTNVSVEAAFLIFNACHLKKLQQKQLKKLKLRNATCEVKFFRRLRVHTIPRVHYIGDCRNVLKTFPESLRLNPQRKVLKQEDFLRFLKRFLPRWRGLNWKKMSSSSRARYRNLWQ